MNALQTRVENLIHDCWKSFSHKSGNDLFGIHSKSAMLLHFARLLQNSLELAIYDKKELVILNISYAVKVEDKILIPDIHLELHNGKESLSIPIILNCYLEGVSHDDCTDFCQKVFQNLEILEIISSSPRTVTGYLLLLTDSKSLILGKDTNPDLDISDGNNIYGVKKVSLDINGEKASLTLKKDYRFEWHQHGQFWFSLIQGV